MLKSLICSGIIAASMWSFNSVAAEIVIENGKGKIDISAGEILYPMIIEEYNGRKCLVGKGIGSAEYEFFVSDSGIYCFWGKAMGADPHSNSFIVMIDDKEPIVWEIPVRKDRTTVWAKIKGFSDKTAGEVSLESGKHKLIIKSREAGARLEAIFVGKKGTEPEDILSFQN